MERVLFVTADVPFPPTAGTPLRTWQHIRMTARHCAVAVLSLGDRAAETAALPGVQAWEHAVVPRAAERAPGGYPMLLGPAAEIARAALARALEALRPSVIVFSNLWISGAAEVLARRTAPAVFDFHNIYSAMAHERGDDARGVRMLERETLRAVDASWVCSDEDAQNLREASGDGILPRVIPNAVALEDYDDVRSGRFRRMERATPSMTFVGSFWYEPNRVAADVLIADVLPRVRAALGAETRLYLVGAAPSAAMTAAAASDRGLVVPGRVPDVRPYLALADVVVVPLRHGGGTRLKILEAFAAGRPVVATPKAVEGLDVQDEQHLLVRDDAEGIAAAVCALWHDRERAGRLADAAFALVRDRYGWDAVAPALRDALADAWALGPSTAASGAKGG